MEKGEGDGKRMRQEGIQSEGGGGEEADKEKKERMGAKDYGMSEKQPKIVLRSS